MTALIEPLAHASPNSAQGGVPPQRCSSSRSGGTPNSSPAVNARTSAGCPADDTAAIGEIVGGAIHFGATAEEWETFADDLAGLGLYADLIPVVSDPSIPTSRHSTLSDAHRGKVPSKLSAGAVVGFPGWQAHHASPEKVARWARKPQLGFGLVCRRARAIDIDVEDEAEAAAIERFASEFFGVELPCRFRSNSPKRALLVFVPSGDELTKSVIDTRHGKIELLGNRQFLVCCGTHPSGVRYQWRNLCPTLPEATPEHYAAFIDALNERFGTGELAVDGGGTRKREADLQISDPLAEWLESQGRVLSYRADGGFNTPCPWQDEHSTPTAEDAAVYWPAGTGAMSAAASSACTPTAPGGAWKSSSKQPDTSPTISKLCPRKKHRPSRLSISPPWLLASLPRGSSLWRPSSRAAS